MLVGCRDIGNEGISRLCRHQLHLKHLDISGCLDLTDVALGNITTHLTALQRLRLNKCRMLTDASVALLKNLHDLHTLDLSECYEVGQMFGWILSLGCLIFFSSWVWCLGCEWVSFCEWFWSLG